MTIGQKVRWFFRLTIPTIMVGWGAYEFVRIWDAGWLWAGYWSWIAFIVSLAGIGWLIEDLRELTNRARNN